MCGICGTASTRRAADPDRLAAMSATLAHRGPDSDGTFVDGGVGLAARRLSIIDLDTGDQPIANEDGSVVVVQNGEIYNYEELTHELRRAGHRFRTHGDTEVLVHAYEEWGTAFAGRLRGMFAIAIWDGRERRLILARDRYGIKPLYYRDDGESIEFASELRALPRGEIDLDALEGFLTFNCVPAPYSIFRETRKLPPGHVLTWNGTARLERYARPAPSLETRTEEEAELVEELRARLRDSVRAHLVSDVPVGVLMSGGVDSCTLAALAAEETGDPVRTFSIGFEERSFNELDDARLVAERYGTQHRELVLRPDAALLLPALAEAFNEPFAERLPTSTRKASLDYRAKRFVRAAHLPPLERHHGWKEIFSPDVRAELTVRRSTFDPVDLLRERFAETEGAPLLARLQDIDVGTYLVDDLLVKTDRSSMAHSLEARVPFLDPIVSGFALALPTRLKVRGLSKKRLLRKAAAPLLPERIVNGRKRGFSIPAAAWLRGSELAPFARDTLAADVLRRQGFFRPEPVARILGEHTSGVQDWSRQLWGLLSFTLWYERHVEQTLPGASGSVPQALVR